MLCSKKGMKILTDPYTKVGYELPHNITVDAVTVSHGHFDHCYTGNITFQRLISTSNAQNINDVFIQGIPSYHDEKQGSLRGGNIIFKYEIDGITLCHLGDLGEQLSEGLLQKIGKVDILFIPVGGTYTIDSQTAKDYAQAIGAKIVIPMHYRPKDGCLDIAEIDDYLQLYNLMELKKMSVSELEVSVGDLPKIQKIIYMERA